MLFQKLLTGGAYTSFLGILFVWNTLNLEYECKLQYQQFHHEYEVDGREGVGFNRFSRGTIFIDLNNIVLHINMTIFIF